MAIYNGGEISQKIIKEPETLLEYAVRYIYESDNKSHTEPLLKK